MATEKKEKKEEQSQLDCVAAELRVLKDRVERMQYNWRKFFDRFVGGNAFPGKKPGEVGAIKIGHVLATLTVSAGIAALVWATGEVDNKTVGSGTYRLDQAASTSQMILVVDQVRCAGMTNTGAFALGGNVMLGDAPGTDTHTINGSTTLKGDLTLIDTTEAYTNSIESDAVGTVVIGRPTAGTMTITVEDNNSTADVVLKGGGNSSVTLGDSAASDTVVIYGALSQNGDVTLVDSTAVYTNTIESDAVGTLTIGRPTSGTMTITVKDDDSAANMVVKGGGNSSVTIGDSGANDTVVLYGALTQNGDVTLVDSTAVFTNTIESDAVGTIMLGRPTAGTMLITVKDDDTTADLTIKGGGNSTVTIGDHATSDSIVLYGVLTQNGATMIKGDVTLIDSTSAYTNTVESDAVGTVTIGRPTAGAVTLTVKDDNSTADVVLKAGGNGAVTLGDSAANDTVVLYGALTQNGDVTLIDSTAAYTNTVESDAVGTITVGRPTAGAMIITAKDDDSTANIIVKAGGNGSVTLGDSGANDTVVLYGALTQNGDVTLLDATAAYTNILKSTAEGTLTLDRPTSGTIIITSSDDDNNAALTVAAGGTGALTIGDADSATSITGSSVDLLKGATVGSNAALVAPNSTALMVQAFNIAADNQHTVLTQALTTAYGDGVSPTVVVTPSAADAALCVSTVASNSFQVTITAGTATYRCLVVGARP